MKISVNKIISLYTIIALFIIAFIEIESAGAVPLRVFYLPYNKGLWLLITTVLFAIIIMLMIGVNRKSFNNVIIMLVIKCCYDLIAVVQGRVITDQTFWYHYSMVFIMPFIYYIYRQYSGKSSDINTLFSIFAIILVLQEVLTIFINGYSFSDLDYKNYLRIPSAHSNIIAVLLLSVLVIRLRMATPASSKYEIINIIIIMGIVLTQSRGATLFIISWWMIISYQKKYGRLSKRAILKLIESLIIIIIIICLSSKIQILLFETTINNIDFWSKASSGRTDLFFLGIIKFLEDPIYGSGLGVEEYNLGYDVVQSGVHNILLDYLIQSGIIGTIIYVYAVYCVFKNKNLEENSSISNGYKLSIWMILGYSMVEVCYFNFSCIYFFWAICGLYDRISVAYKR